MKKKNFLSVLLTGVILTTVLSGCGNGNNSQETQAASTEESKVESTQEVQNSETAETISMMCWYDEKVMKTVLEAINEELGGAYTVEYTYVALNDFNNVLSTQLAAGEGPDIVVDGTNFPARIKAGNVKEITGSDFLNEFNEAGLSLCSDGEKRYGVPSYGWFSGIWYNKDILAEAGVEVPKNFSEFVAACEKISETTYLPIGFGLADGDSANHSLLGYLENSFYHNNKDNASGTQFDTDFAKGNVTLAGNYNDSVNEWYELVEKGFINPEMLGISGEEALNSFIAGNTAFFNGGPWQYANLKDAGLNFGMIPHLSKTGSDVYMLGGPAVNFGINVNTKNEEGAGKVLEALASLPVQQAFVDANVGGFSYREGVVADMPEEYADVEDVISSGNISCPWDRWGINMPAQALVDESVAQVQGLVSGELTVEQYIEAIDAKANSIRFE